MSDRQSSSGVERRQRAVARAFAFAVSLRTRIQKRFCHIPIFPAIYGRSVLAWACGPSAPRCIGHLFEYVYVAKVLFRTPFERMGFECMGSNACGSNAWVRMHAVRMHGFECSSFECMRFECMGSSAARSNACGSNACGSMHVFECSSFECIGCECIGFVHRCECMDD
jgi:hypothetical protein